MHSTSEMFNTVTINSDGVFMRSETLSILILHVTFHRCMVHISCIGLYYIVVVLKFNDNETEQDV